MQAKRTFFALIAVTALAACGSGGSDSRSAMGPVDPGPGEPTDPVDPPPSAPGETTDYVWDLPPGFPEPLVPEDNPMTVEGVELGRHLFYERRLSENGTQSCGDCHEQALAFSDGRARSIGSTGEETPRNSPSLTNVTYNPTLTWMNPLLNLLEDQVLGPLFDEDPVELGFSGREDELLARLRGEALYQVLFGDAFPNDDDPVSLGNTTKAIASFERTLLSGNSPFDKFVYQGDDDAMSEAARRGFDLFDSETLECNHCHGGLNFASSLAHAGNPVDAAPFENTGLYNLREDGEYPYPNSGLFEFTQSVRDHGRMKPPTLRNIEVTGPYMHDGSIETLEDVMRHYERGGRLISEGPLAGDGRINPNKSDFLTGFPLTNGQRADVIEFFKSLTDHEFLNDPRFSNPFPDQE
ncbi:MAG: di-heme enzyme [Candidatus Binatia bacterium]|nr:di-heme enzyme [Candidatus Binatia bacterium]